MAAPEEAKGTLEAFGARLKEWPELEKTVAKLQKRLERYEGTSREEFRDIDQAKTVEAWRSERTDIVARLEQARTYLLRNFPEVRRLSRDVGIEIQAPEPFSHVVAMQVQQAIGEYDRWIETGERPGGPISLSEFGDVQRLPPSEPPPAPVGMPQEDRLDKANKRRHLLAWVMFGLAAILAILAITWTGCMLLALEDSGLLYVDEMTMGVGLVLIGKSLMTVVLLGAAFATLRAGERLILPVQEYLDYVQRISKNPAADEDELVNRVVDRVVKTIKPQ